ncbi:MAG: hypothetical protein QG597_4667 [Actinomycetota bacterium]|nr:hypothetical protein [Actinomycetota bacterium]
MTGYVFAYGSLLNPESLARTVPNARLSAVVGARLVDFVRTFNVAFPNDGSQGDKAYFDDRGRRPPTVLFANVVPSSDGHAANGVLVPLGPGDLSLLIDRERRYEVVDVTESIRLLDPSAAAPTSVCAFVGRDRFTRAAEVGHGVLSREYLETIATGVHHWERTYPGFVDEYRSTTRLHQSIPVRDLVRVNAATG